MSKEQLDALWEAVKEAGRYAVLLAISTFISVLAEKVAKMPQNETTIIVLTLVLRGLDKYIHEKRKEETRGIIGTKSNIKGLLPF